MMMKLKARTSLAYLILAVRVALVWWVALVIVVAIFSRDVAFLGGLILFPPIALIIGCVAAWQQRRAMALGSSSRSPLTSGERQTISLALPKTQAMRIAESAIESVFGQVEKRITDNAITAHVIESGVKLTGMAALRSDQIIITAADDGQQRSTLQIVCEPRHVWLYALFWVEAGRSTRQVEALRVGILARVRAQGEAVDSLHRQHSLQSRLAEAELLLLRAQVEPHFLYNTLAHIRASIAASPQIAQVMLDALIAFMRANSQTASRANVSVADELQRIENYLKIMQIRLGERLCFSIECDASILALQVPNACILILVENAVKHGIERSGTNESDTNGSDTNGMISIKCQHNADVLNIDVNNDGPGLAAIPPSGEGGLSNLRERLQLTYGADAKMTIEGREEGGVCASLRIPMKARE